jgi:Phage terminase large subunit
VTTQTISLTYDPNPKQKEAHSLAAKFRSFCGGWGNGKTSWGCAETFTRLVEYPGTRCIVARKTRPELRSTSWDMLLNGDVQDGAWPGIPKQLIRKYNRSDLYLELWNESTVQGLPLDDPKKIENYNLGLFWIDQAEEVEEDIFIKFHGRLRQHNAPREGLLTWNPAGHSWLWRYFVNPKRSDKFKRQYQCVEATTFDNPNLPPDYFDAFSHLPDHWYQRFIMGSHEVFVGQIFTDWNPDVHIVEPFRIPSGWERWCCIDPGIRHEGCASWVARDPLGNAYYYREILEAGQTIDWWAGEVLNAEAENDIGGPDEEIWRRLIGPEARQKSQTDGRSVLDLYHEYGIYPEIADRDPGARISRITEYLRPKPGHLPPFGRLGLGVETPLAAVEAAPRLYVFSTCEKLQEYLPQYRWRPQRINYSEEELPEKPRKKDDHNVDCLGHILVAVDDLPPVEDNSEPLSPEQQFLDEHFESEVGIAVERQAVRGYRKGRIPSAA